MTRITAEKLAAMSVHQRHNLLKNARKIDTPEARELVKLIQASGLPYADSKTISLDDPIALKMHDIIFSDEGCRAMLAAMDSGWPALAGVDPIIAGILGVDYGSHNMTTNTAGALVVERMGQLGYRKSGRTRSLPLNCVARSGVLFEKIGGK